MSDAADHPHNTEAPGSLAQAFNLSAVITGMLQDLEDRRAGRISVQDARVRADLGKNVLRGMQLLVSAQKMLEDQAKPVPAAIVDSSGSEP